jgi:flagellar secretion chaperone FliS
MQNANFYYREAAVRGASKIRLVVLLYEQIIRDLNAAVRAVDQNNIERRCEAINHAITVIGHLQSTLDLHLEAPVVQHLSKFYTMLRSRLVEANARTSRQILLEQVSYLLEMRDAWVEVEQAESSGLQRPAAVQSKTAAHWEG